MKGILTMACELPAGMPCSVGATDTRAWGPSTHVHRALRDAHFAQDDRDWE